MSYAQGLQMGYNIASDAGKTLRAGYAEGERKRNMKAIAGELTKDYSSELTDLNEAAPAEVKARVAQGEQEAAAVRGAADAMAPAQPAQFNMTQPTAVAPAPAAPAPSQVGGLQMPKAGTPYAPPVAATTAMQGDVMGTAAEGAKVTPGRAADELRTETKRTVVNPMQDYLRYQGAAAKAAELGDLELQKAYSDMAAANFKTGILKTAGEALKALDQGDTKLLEYTMTKFVPNGLKYTNGKVNEDGSVNFDLVGAEGETKPVTLTRDEIMRDASMLANPEYITKLYEANVAAQADLAKYKRDRAGKLQDKEIDRQVGLEKLQITEGGANARAAATNALGWFKANSSNAIDAARLKLQTLVAQGKMGSGAMKNVKDWAGLGLAPTQVNRAVRLVAEGNDPNIVFDAVSGGFDPTTVKFAPGIGGYVTAAGGGEVKLNAGDLFKDIADPKVAEAAKSSYVSSVAGALDQQSPAWKQDWTAASPTIKAAILESQGVGMGVAEFEKYAGLGAKPKAVTRPSKGLTVSPRATPMGAPTQATGYPAGVKGSAPTR